MKISYDSINEVCVTFKYTGDLSEGSLVKMTVDGTVTEASVDDIFIGVVKAVGDGICTVQVAGFVTVYQDNGMPTIGWTDLVCDGFGNVIDGSGNGRYCLVVEADLNSNKLTFMM